MKKKLLVACRRFGAFGVVAISIFFVIFTIALVVETLPFKILTSPAPQVLMISTSIFVALGIVWATLAKRSRKIKKSRVLYIGIFGIALALLSIVFTLSIQPPQQASKTTKNQIVFTTYNRLYQTTDLKIPTDYLRQQRSDIISLQEVSSPNYAGDFAEAVGLNYYLQASENDVALISRWPIKSYEIRQNGIKQVIRAEIETPQGIVAAYSVHVTPPFSEAEYHEGLRQLQAISSWVANDKLPVVVGGDYNTAIYAPEMRAHTKQIASTAKPTTEQRWPACSWYGYGRVLCLRIDHVFIPAKSTFYGSNISPDLGSDHRAVTVRFSL